jgi:hypothetical protein
MQPEISVLEETLTYCLSLHAFAKLSGQPLATPAKTRSTYTKAAPSDSFSWQSTYALLRIHPAIACSEWKAERLRD